MDQKKFWFYIKWFFINPALLFLCIFYFYSFCNEDLSASPIAMILTVLYLIKLLAEIIKIARVKNKIEYEHAVRVKTLVECRKKYDLAFEKISDKHVKPMLILFSIFFFLPFIMAAYGISIRNTNPTWKALLFFPIMSYFVFNQIITNHYIKTLF